MFDSKNLNSVETPKNSMAVQQNDLIIRKLDSEDWGLVDYQVALQRQLDVISKVQSGENDTIIYCSHPPVVTLGRAALPSDVFNWNGKILNIQRGGRATYHGPSQLVIYPIVQLNRRTKNQGLKLFGIPEYLKKLESFVVEVLAHYGIKAQGKCGSKIQFEGQEMDGTGVWVGQRKICSIGIGVKRWVTYHGLALNVDHDPNAFRGMNPCGFNSETMVSMEELLGKRVSREEIKNIFKKIISFQC